MRDDRGSGSILGVAIIAAVLCVFGLLLPLASALVLRQRVETSADASALAAADVAVGIHGGVPCETARSVASANGVEVDGCEVDGASVSVRIRAEILGFSIRATATAGQPP